MPIPSLATFSPLSAHDRELMTPPNPGPQDSRVCWAGTASWAKLETKRQSCPPSLSPQAAAATKHPLAIYLIIILITTIATLLPLN